MLISMAENGKHQTKQQSPNVLRNQLRKKKIRSFNWDHKDVVSFSLLDFLPTIISIDPSSVEANPSFVIALQIVLNFFAKTLSVYFGGSDWKSIFDEVIERLKNGGDGLKAFTTIAMS